MFLFLSLVVNTGEEYNSVNIILLSLKLPVTLRVIWDSLVNRLKLELLIGLKAFLVFVASWGLTTPLTCLFVGKQF